MSNPNEKPTVSSIARTQSAVTLAVALAVLATCAAVDLAARNESLGRWVQSRRLTQWKRNDSTYQHAMGFVDFENRLLIDEIPRADYSHGGVYFIGSSTVVMSLMTWELPPRWRDLIHNYGISGASHAQQFHFVRYLIEHEKLLVAGGEKTLIVLGLFYGNAAETERGANGRYVPELFRSHGLFSYHDVDGIRPVNEPDPQRLLRLEKARCGNFIRRTLYNCGLSGDFNIGIRPDVRPTPDYTIEQRQQFWRQRMGADWRKTMVAQVGAMQRLIEYLQERNVRVVGVFMPSGSWHDDLPYEAAYRRQVTATCNRGSVPLMDLSRLLPDDHFSDSVHYKYQGERKLHTRLTKFATAYLRQTGRSEPNRLVADAAASPTRPALIDATTGEAESTSDQIDVGPEVVLTQFLELRESSGGDSWSAEVKQGNAGN